MLGCNSGRVQIWNAASAELVARGEAGGSACADPGPSVKEEDFRCPKLKIRNSQVLFDESNMSHMI